MTVFSTILLTALPAAVPQPEHPFLRNFATTGTVTSTAGNGNFTLETAERPVYIFNRLPHPPQPGQVIAARGYVELGIDRRENPCLQEFTVLGVTNLPSPIVCTIADINDEKFIFRNVRTTGVVVDVIRDEIDPNYLHMVLKDGPDVLHVASLDTNVVLRTWAQQYLNATVEVTGNCSLNLGGSRAYAGPSVGVKFDSDMRILQQPPDDPFDVPELESTAYISPLKVMQMGRRSVRGLVTATWNGNQFLLRTTDARDVQVTLAQTATLPTVGSCVCAAGHPDTDLYRLNLIYAEWRSCDRMPVAIEPVQDIRVRSLFRDAAGRIKFNTRQHGKLLRLRGIVRGCSPDEGIVTIESDSFLIPIRTLHAQPVNFEIGTHLEATGICLMETESWRPNLILPRIKNVQLITRKPDDIRILKRPPWWTPGRFLAVISTLFIAMVAILIWNRFLNHLVEKRSRQLFREQVARSSSELKVDERTRLAVELHDTLSQKLAGVAYQIASLRQILKKKPDVATAHLKTAEQMLASCRTELRHCLFDLRSDALEVSDFADAIRLCLSELKMSATITVDFALDRKRLHDATAHAILCIIRELASNAHRHGHATAIHVRGRFNNGRLIFSVCDNGCGFDCSNHPGVADGHFGLYGIEERIKRLRGSFRIESSSALGTTAICEIRATQPELKEYS